MTTAAAPWSWTPTPTGYDATDGRARLVRDGKRWTLELPDGRSFPLPRRASFDHAEGVLAREGTH